MGAERDFCFYFSENKESRRVLIFVLSIRRSEHCFDVFFMIRQEEADLKRNLVRVPFPIFARPGICQCGNWQLAQSNKCQNIMLAKHILTLPNALFLFILSFFSSRRVPKGPIRASGRQV